MSISSRIKKIREEFCNDSNIDFANALGVSRQYANNLVTDGKSIGNKVIDNILSKFPAINPVWLKMGVEPMLNTDTPKAESNTNNDSLVEFLKEKIKELEVKNERLIEENTELKLLLKQNGIDIKKAV